MDGKTIYENFTTGPGGERLHGAAAILRKVEAEYEMWAADVRELTAKMESAWSGDAAGAARRGAGPLVVEHEMARPELTTAQDLTIRQVDSFDQAKNSVQPIPNQPEKPGFWDNVTSLGGASDDYESQMRGYNGANDQNVQVMRQYEDSSNYNASGMPQSYGNLTPDQSEIVIGSEPKTPPPDDGGPPGERNRPPNINGTDQSGTNGWTPPGNVTTQPAQTTTPSGWTPPSSTLPGQPPVNTLPVNPPPNIGYPPPGGWPPGTLPPGALPPGSRPPGGQFPPGSRPPGGGPYGPGGPGGSGGPGSGQGMRGGGGGGGGFGPGGSGAGGPGAGGPRSGAMGGAGGMFGGGDDHHNNQNRGGSGAGARGGGAPMGGGAGGAGGKGEEDLEHQAPSYLLESDPDAIFGTDEITAPPVIGG